MSKVINSEIGLKSFQQYLVVDCVEGLREIGDVYVDAVSIATYMRKIIEDVMLLLLLLLL